MRSLQNFDPGRVLADWYAVHSGIRRLWAISGSQGMRVIVALEPTNDGDDIYPAWLANAGRWARELQLLLGEAVQMEVVEPLRGKVAPDVDAVVVAELFWRDPAHFPGFEDAEGFQPKSGRAGATSAGNSGCGYSRP